MLNRFGRPISVYDINVIPQLSTFINCLKKLFMQLGCFFSLYLFISTKWLIGVSIDITRSGQGHNYLLCVTNRMKRNQVGMHKKFGGLLFWLSILRFWFKNPYIIIAVPFKQFVFTEPEGYFILGIFK